MIYLGPCGASIGLHLGRVASHHAPRLHTLTMRCGRRWREIEQRHPAVRVKITSSYEATQKPALGDCVREGLH